MSMREEQAFNDGRLAYRAGQDSNGGSRRSVAQRAAWRRGYDHEQQLDRVAQAAPADLEQSRNVVSKLKAWATENL